MPKQVVPERARAGRQETDKTFLENITSVTYWQKFAHKGVFLFLALIMAVSMVAYFALRNFGDDRGAGGRRGGEGANEPILTVNGITIPRLDYERARANNEQQQRQFRQQFAALGGMSESESQKARQEGSVVSGLIDNALQRSIAKERGLKVTDADVNETINTIRKSGGKDKELSDKDLDQLLASQGMTLDDLRGQLKEQLAGKKLLESIEATQNLTEDDLVKSYDELKLRHILIAVQGAPRPAQGAMPDGQAKTRAEKVLEKVKAGGDFAKLADEYTMDPSNKTTAPDPKTKKPVTKTKGGDLDWYKRGGGFDATFEDAAFKLKKGETSGLVKTPFGYHIIKVEDTRRTLPQDFDKQKAQLLTQFKEQRAEPELKKLVDEARKTAQIEWKDRSVKWRYDYSQLGSAPGTDVKKAQDTMVAELRDYVTNDPKGKEDAPASLVLGELLQQQYALLNPAPPVTPPDPKGTPPTPPAPAADTPEKQKLRQEIVTAYETALKTLEDRNARFELAKLYREEKQNDKAMEQYKRVQKQISWDDNTADLSDHQRLAQVFRELGETALADKEAQKVTLLQTKQQEEMRQQMEKMKANQPGGGTTVAPGGTLNVLPDGAAPDKAPEKKPDGKPGDKPAATPPGPKGAAPQNGAADKPTPPGPKKP